MLGMCKDLMDESGADWTLCGDSAIDLFAGKQTRLHKDIDVAVFWEDRERLIRYFLKKNWRIFEPDHGLLREITEISNVYQSNDNLWCMDPEANTYSFRHQYNNFYEITTERKHQDVLDFVELLFNRRENGRA